MFYVSTKINYTSNYKKGQSENIGSTDLLLKLQKVQRIKREYSTVNSIKAICEVIDLTSPDAVYKPDNLLKCNLNERKCLYKAKHDQASDDFQLEHLTLLLTSYKSHYDGNSLHDKGRLHIRNETDRKSINTSERSFWIKNEVDKQIDKDAKAYYFNITQNGNSMISNKVLEGSNSSDEKHGTSEMDDELMTKKNEEDDVDQITNIEMESRQTDEMIEDQKDPEDHAKEKEKKTMTFGNFHVTSTENYLKADEETNLMKQEKKNTMMTEKKRKKCPYVSGGCFSQCISKVKISTPRRGAIGRKLRKVLKYQSLEKGDQRQQLLYCDTKLLGHKISDDADPDKNSRQLTRRKKIRTHMKPRTRRLVYGNSCT